MKYALLFLSLLSLQSFAGQIGKVTIKEVLVAHNGTNNTFIKVSTDQNDRPSCHTNTYGWDFVFDATTERGKILLSSILTAQTTGKKVDIYGTNDCLLSNVESLSHIILKDF